MQILSQQAWGRAEICISNAVPGWCSWPLDLAHRPQTLRACFSSLLIRGNPERNEMSGSAVIDSREVCVLWEESEWTGCESPASALCFSPLEGPEYRGAAQGAH